MIFNQQERQFYNQSPQSIIGTLVGRKLKRLKFRRRTKKWAIITLIILTFPLYLFALMTHNTAATVVGAEKI